jgi:F420-dependent oxidoreductase-like protein
LKRIKVGIFLGGREVCSKGWNAVRDLTLECERLGYDSIWLGDHLTRGVYRLECWTILSALSTLTKRIRLGPLVLCNSFRRPSLLAKMNATLDVISGGRLEFGIGACWHQGEHKAYGIPFPKLSIRATKLSEGLEIIKRMWTLEKSSYKGKYYQIREAYCEPKPLQKPHPPITVGGSGEKIMLKVVASHADRCNFQCSVKEFQHKLKVLKDCCSKIGRNFREIEKSFFSDFASIYTNEKELMDDMLGAYNLTNRSVPFSDWLKRIKLNNILGTPEVCLSRMKEYTDIGITYFMLRFTDPLRKKESLKLFVDEVVKKL